MYSTNLVCDIFLANRGLTEMKLYKILHKPSGLFYKPCRHDNKRNLSRKGKVYQTKPNIESFLTFCGGLSYTDYVMQRVGCIDRETEVQVPTVLSDWQLIELKATEAV